MLKVIKRTGDVHDFDLNKVCSAIERAFMATNLPYTPEILERLALRAVSRLKTQLPYVEAIQDAVEACLMDSGFDAVAKAYILYREQRAKLRDWDSTMLNFSKTMETYLDRSDWRVKENSTVTFSLGGLILHGSGTLTANYWLKEIYDSEVANAHRNGDMHIHDLSMLSGYCAGWSLEQLIREGLGGVEGRITSSPAKHLSTLTNQMVNFLGIMQNEWAGAQAFSSFDTYLAPFVKIDNLSLKETKQAIQSFIYGVNTPSRWGTQAPFTNITMDWVVPERLRNTPALVGGVTQDFTYGDCQEEMNTVNRAFLEIMLEGDANGRGFQYPIPTYNITKDFDWDNENAAMLFEITSKYGTPYFQNFVNSDLNPDDVRSMCPISGNEKVLIKSHRYLSPELVNIRNLKPGKIYEVYAEGKYVKGLFNRFDNKQMVTITLTNGHKLTTTTDHLNFALVDGEVKEIPSSDLTAEMYLPYSLKVLEGTGGSYDLGYLVGAFAGDGSLMKDNTGVPIGIKLSLNNEKKMPVVEKISDFVISEFGACVSTATHGKLYTLKVHSAAVAGLCNDFVRGISTEKHYSAAVYDMSLEFRKGLIAGHYATDGGNRHRIYTSSEKMVESLNLLASTMGTTTAVFVDERDGRLSNNPNYAVLIYQLNRNNYGDTWVKKDDRLWIKIKSVEPAPGNVGYCFTITDGDPLFTVATTGILTHNCRLQLDKRELRRRGGGLFGSDEFTGSVGVVTINIPRIAYLSSDEDEFFNRLDRLLEVASRSLEIKRKIVERLYDEGLYPYTKRYLTNLDNHFSTIGLVGLNEACLNAKWVSQPLFDDNGRLFGLRVLDHMRKRIADFQETTGHLYNLEATPAESTSYRLARIDKKKFSGIITSGTETPYYTNSSHLPVDYTDDIFSALEFQEDFQTRYTGGTVFHAFLGQKISDWTVCRSLVQKIATGFRLPYFTISPTYSVCPNHGYIQGEERTCPICGAETEVYSRITGYYRPVKNWNDGKQEEYKERREYSLSFREVQKTVEDTGLFLSI